MREVLLRLVDVPIARILVLAGFIFVLVGILGKIEGKIEPGTAGRISSAILGVMLLGIGVFMQYSELKYAELHEINAKAQMDQAALSLAASSAPASAVAAAPVIPIKVVSGTYGRNCNAKVGNATAPLSVTCDGQSSCDFVIDTTALADPAPNCSKDFAAEWKCGEGSAVYSAALPSLNGSNDKLRLSCFY
ncbi:MAG: hypothetical protein Q7U91_07255 [Sideroxyarcus sp.]|nr:hypothetical protein [Sideroxyarcus sp.]